MVECCTEVFGSVAEWVEVLFAIFAFIVAIWQWRKSCAITRADHLKGMLEDFNSDTVSSGFRNLIDRLDEDRKPFHFYMGNLLFKCAEYESIVDTMLLTFSRICYEHENNLIDDDEFAFFRYQIDRTLENQQISDYLYDLAEFSISQEKQYPYMPLVNEGVSVKLTKYRETAQTLKSASKE